MKKLIGCHLSSSKGYEAMAKQAMELGATTFQFFTRNPRGTKAKALDLEDITKFKEIWNTPYVAHAPYILNLCSKREDLRELAVDIIKDDLQRLTTIGCPYYNIHPGSHTQQGADIGIIQIADGINEILKVDTPVTFCLETMSGKGTEMGRTFDELKAIYDRIDRKDKIGYVLDTCHIFDGGYDIRTELDLVIDNFDRTLGIENLKAIHLNDSKNTLNSHKDRHEKLGEGNIGIDAIEHIVNHPRLKSLPFILETPNELDGYKKEIALIKNLSK
ncbi:MAG: deoxyribonuclease IV [Sphaerochaetaceae bacterium]